MKLQDIVVGKPRDGDDRIDWLIQYARFEDALTILEADSSLHASSHEKVLPLHWHQEHVWLDSMTV